MNARARQLVTAALAREPKLTAHGPYGVYGAVAKWGRAYLLSDAGLDDVEACARWLEERRERWPVEATRSADRPDEEVGGWRCRLAMLFWLPGGARWVFANLPT